MLKSIQSRKVALSVIKDAATVFFIVAIVNWLVVIIRFPPLAGIQFIDSLVTVVLAAMVLRLKSRASAVILLIQSVGGFIVLSYLWLTVEPGDFNYGYGPKIILALILSYASVRAVQATYLLQGRFSKA
jgi:hypothetical protein